MEKEQRESRSGEKFTEELANLGIELNEHQKEQFDQYYELLVEWNKVMNLTAITEFEDVVEKHFLDSISLCQVMDLKKPLTLLDLGTGAGFPGIPLKIMFPELKITLADSLNKRLLFLNEVMEALNLKNIETVHGRAEELSKRKDYRESFDLCVSRAVANLSTLSEYCLPFIHTSGKFISYKSGEVDDELKDAKKAVFVLGGEIEDVIHFTLPDSDIKRSFVVINKVHATPKAYPRKAGTPSKNPLK